MFSARRKPKRNLRDRSDAKGEDEEVEENGPVVVKRPGATKTKSKLRISFQPDEVNKQPDSTDEKRPTNAQSSTTSTQTLPRFAVDRQDDSRPSYSKDALAELKDSTPSTPRELQIVADGDANLALDVASKFGTLPATRPSTIPSAAEIREKKERRARLAQEHGSEDFISLEDYDSDGEFKPQRMQVGLYSAGNDSGKDTRLVRDDEDFAEGFDEFVEDHRAGGRAGHGRILTMGARGTTAQDARNERRAIQEMINAAEGARRHGYDAGQDSDDMDDDEASDSETEERNHAFMSAQTQHGMDGLMTTSARHRLEMNRPRPPKEIVQIPKLATALNRLRESVQRIEMEKVRIEKRRADLRQERVEIKASQDHIQRSLEEAGRELETLNLNSRSTVQDGDTVMSSGQSPAATGRGLESLGTSTA